MTETPYNFVKDKRLDALKQWLSANEVTFERMSTASADAGFRRYFRLHMDKYTRIAVDAPPEYEDTGAFLDIARRLSTSGLHAPEIYCYSLEKGFLLIEDLGQIHFQNALERIQLTNRENKLPGSSQAAEMYNNAIQVIVHMQHHIATDNLPAYDRNFIATELNLFPAWYLSKHLKLNIGSAQQAVIDDTFTLLTDSAIEQPQAFMHRDFHCRNLMLTGPDNIAIIDFQGAMTGPVTYDPVSLLKDVYLQWPTSFRDPLMEQHRLTLAPEIDRETYQRWFDYMGLQRHLKILGIFSRLNYRDNKPDYMNNIPIVCSHIKTTLAQYPELSDFAHLFSQIHKEKR